jgi:hypothetical protein
MINVDDAGTRLPAKAAAANEPGAVVGQRLDLALARLTASRMRLQVLMMPVANASPSRGAGGTWPPRRWRALWRSLRSGSKSSSPFGAALNTAAVALQAWWQHQPAHASLELLAKSVCAQAAPLIRKYPWWTVALGAASGYALARTRPWRLPMVNAQFNAGVRSLKSWAWSLLTQSSVQTLIMGAWAVWMAKQTKAAGPEVDAK